MFESLERWRETCTDEELLDCGSTCCVELSGPFGLVVTSWNGSTTSKPGALIWLALSVVSEGSRDVSLFINTSSLHSEKMKVLTQLLDAHCQP